MIDIETKQPMEVYTEGTAGPYLLVPLEQLEPVTIILNRNGVRFSIAKNAIELDGKPVIALVDFGINADAKHIQQVLDAA